MFAQVAFLLYSANKAPAGRDLALDDFMLTKEPASAKASGAKTPTRRRSLAGELEHYFLGG
jgi:hypothetical protein